MGLGLHNDLQNEHSIVGNNVGLLLLIEYGTDDKAEWIDDLAEGKPGLLSVLLGDHGSDATHMETTAVRDGDGGLSMAQNLNTGIHKTKHDLIFAHASSSRRATVSPLFDAYQ